MIEIKNLSFRFEKEFFFENINLSLPKNKINVIVGPNGVGKTTLLRLICGLLKPVSGDIDTNKSETFYLPQKISYTYGVTLYEYLTSIFYQHTWKWRLTCEEKTKIENIMRELEISDKKDILVENLSSGEFQKANIALGLLSGAKILLLDEPVSNIDLINQIKILEIIKKLSQEVTVVVILHDLNLASRFGDYFIGINKNKEFFCAQKTEFFTCQLLEKVYGINFKINKDGENYNVQIPY